MLQTSCLYARGITPVFLGDPGSGTQSAVDALSMDASRYTSFVIDGHSLAYVCGYASVYMNGSFIRDGSQMVTAGYGWMGNYRNANINFMGALRQLQIQQGYNMNLTNGSTMLVMSDSASVTDETSMESWGQYVSYMQRLPLDIVAHHWTEINAGAYGYDATVNWFKQWSGVMLLLSSTVQSLPQNMVNALREALRNGVSIIVLQKGPYEGNVNFNAIFSALGIVSSGAGYVGATPYSHDRAISAFGNHVGWTNVPSLHNQQNYRLSACYQYNVATQAGPATIGGQPGLWRQFYCGQVDIPDDFVLDPPILYRDPCCVEIGSAYGVNFDVTTYPQKPDDWPARLAAGDVSVTWSNRNGNTVQERSAVYCHSVGAYSQGGGVIQPYTVINGVYWLEPRGFSVYIISKATTLLVDRRTFDVTDNAAQAAQMAAYLNSISSDYWVVVTSAGDAAQNRLLGGLPEAMYRIGASRRVFAGSDFYSNSSYACFGSPGSSEGNAINEMYWGPEDNSVDSWFDVGYAFDSGGYPYITGTNRQVALSMALAGLFENTKSSHISYYKVLGGTDGAKTYGMQHTVTIRDNRFKKLPMYETKDFVVSVTNPCFSVPKVQSHDWVRRVAFAGAGTVYYPFSDLNEYLVITTDEDGPNELCTSHLMMNWEMFDGVGGNVAYNEAGPDHLMFCGGDRNNPASLYFQATNGSLVWQVYERKYNLISGMPSRNTNDWQVFWKWNGPGSQGHFIQIDPGFEYIVFAYDRYGDLELAERHFIVPEAGNLPAWGSNFYNVDFSNSTVFELNRSLQMNARCTKSENNGNENGIMMIIRRPLFMSTGATDRTGWQLVMNNNGTSVPRGKNYPLYFESDYQYMVLCSTGNGGFSTHHFNGWNKVFSVPFDSTIEAESCGRCQWSQDRRSLLDQDTRLSTNAKEFLSSSYAPVGVFQVYRRPILCWEPSEI